MFENMFNGMFGKVQAGMCRITMNGGVAVKTSNGYKTYNLKKETLTNVTNFCFPMGDEFFFVVPTNKVAVGDIILVEKKPKCVIKVDKKIITVIDYENSEVRQVVPERHIFMGATYFYGKIVSMLGNTLKGGNGIGNVMKMAIMSSMFSGNKGSTDSGSGMFGGMGDMGQMMAMSMMMGGKDNPFGDMFSGMFDNLSLSETEDEEDDDSDEESEEK